MCIPGEYTDIGYGCRECPDKFATCNNSLDGISCRDTPNRLTLVEGCLCKDYFYEDPDSKGCIQCPKEYENCTQEG